MEIKTDNSFELDKVMLRAVNLPDKDVVRVLDCFGGKGLVWAGVRRLSNKQIERTAIDVRHDIEQAHIHGDNRKILAGLDLSCYDVIDLDAYGIPYVLLRQIFDMKFNGHVFVTFIQSIHGQMPKELLGDIGLKKEMVEKSPSLFSRRGWEYFLEWLALNGVTRIRHRSKSRKHYLHFRLGDISDAEPHGEDCGSRAEERAASLA